MGNISKHFDRKEFECQCGCGFDTVDAELIAILEDLRNHFQTAVHINSGCRCEAHNKAVKGESNSQHCRARAADVVVENESTKSVYDYLNSKYPEQYGMGLYNSWVHIDSRKQKARWTK